MSPTMSMYGHLVQLCIPDLAVHAFAPVVDFDSQAGGSQLGGGGPGVFDVAVGNRDYRCLRRGQPHRERASVVLNEYAHESLHGPEDRPVDHVRPVLPTIFGYIRQLEAAGEIEVKLDGGALPLSTDGVFDLDVDLRAIECPASAVDLVVDAHVLEGVAKCGGGSFPLGFLTDILFGAVGEEDLVVAEPECPQEPEGEVENAADLVF